MRRKFSLTFAAACLATGALLLAGCTAGAGDKPAANDTKQDSATLALIGTPVNLDFTTSAGAAIPQALMENVYQGLVKVDAAGKISPQLAKKWEVSEDRKDYTFTLQDGVTFTNGDPFTAADVKFSFERVKTAWTTSLKNKMNVVDSVEVKSDSEVVVHLSHPSNSWLFDMTTLVGAIFSPNGVDDLANKAVGTGPFTVESWKPNESIQLTARDDYWGDKPAVKNVTLKYFTDANATTNALRTGDVDAVINLQSPELVDTFKTDDKFKVISGLTNGEVALAFNNRVAPFNDLRVRQAVLYALDRQAIIDTAWNGYGSLTATFVTPKEPYYVDLNDEYAYNPEKAKELLKAAGQENLQITYKVPTLPYAKAASEIVVSQLKEVGIDVKIESSEFPAVWLDEVFTKHDYQMTSVAHVEARDLVTLFNNPDYYIGYDNSKIAPLLAEADEADEAGYIAGMKKVQQQIVDDAASGVLFVLPYIVIVDAKLQGLPENAVTDALDVTNLSWSK